MSKIVNTIDIIETAHGAVDARALLTRVAQSDPEACECINALIAQVNQLQQRIMVMRRIRALSEEIEMLRSELD